MLLAGVFSNYLLNVMSAIDSEQIKNHLRVASLESIGQPVSVQNELNSVQVAVFYRSSSNRPPR